MTFEELISAIPQHKRVEIGLALVALELYRTGGESFRSIASDIIALAASYPHGPSIDRAMFMMLQMRKLGESGSYELATMAGVVSELLTNKVKPK